MASKAAAAAASTSKSATTQLRLIALPLCRKPDLIYYYAHKRAIKGKQPETTEQSAPSASSEEEDAPGAQVSPIQGTEKSQISQWITKATNKATEQWEKLGNADKGNWKHKIYMTGERLMDRIEYEEWLLKALDATTAPKIPKRISRSEGKAPPLEQDGTVVPLYFPPSQISKDALEANLRQMVERRDPHHDKLMKRSFWLMPLTLPVGLIPVIPNLPFFYVCWRAWSHWRALKSSQYLKGILDSKQLHSEPSTILDELYARRKDGQKLLTELNTSYDLEKAKEASAQADQLGQHQNEEPQILLSLEMVDEVVKRFELGEQAGVDLRRAIHQLEARLKEKPAQ